MDFDPLPKTAICRFVLAYWQDLRGERLRPRRTEIDPAGFARHLPYVGLLEVQSPSVTLCRLAGTAFRQSLGFELTGHNVVHLYPPDLHRAAGYRFWMMATQPCGATVELAVKFSTGLDTVHEIVMLPLDPDQAGGPTILLVAVAPVAPLEWQNTAILPRLAPSSTFRFVDIGAGTPAVTMPPDDFAG